MSFSSRLPPACSLQSEQERSREAKKEREVLQQALGAAVKDIGATAN